MENNILKEMAIDWLETYSQVIDEQLEMDKDKETTENYIATRIIVNYIAETMKNPVGYLPVEQLRKAYKKQQHIDDVKGIKETFHECMTFYEYSKYKLDDKPVTEEEFDKMANVYRKWADDRGGYWAAGCWYAIHTVLKERNPTDDESSITE